MHLFLKKLNAQNGLKCKIDVIFFILVYQLGERVGQPGWYKLPTFSADKLLAETPNVATQM